MYDRRYKRLCYNCEEKWHLGHKCKSTKLYLMKATDDDVECDVE